MTEDDSFPPNASPPRPIDRLLAVMARLRDPEGGCPWDLEQNFATIAPYTIEEAYEVADAIEQNDMAALRDELGDLLLQVVFHARMAEEAGHFAFDDVAEAISDKMVSRHPHVFGDHDADTPDDVKVTWEAQKEAERRSKAGDNGETLSALDGVTAALPALLRAEKLQKRAARVRFDWPEVGQVFDKLDEEVGEIRSEIAAGGDPDRLEDEVGDLLFVAVNLARHLKVDPESALRRTNAKFERRFRAMEADLAGRGEKAEDQSLEALEELWQAAKRAESAS
ncbi:nucleoside triphosphate pyrophosphohydrolase [Pelagibius marinus]|uniref:nucleoside triphosphate pyrophosphohydrolase n=1 Tax=Pelagibius marinus TaxID=2762760 RepID=UPI001872DEEC|nr:nucleoside triphosphate pyrophosphohydrolase [Pelagibius marinus]